jgi:hypothetical protein
LRRPLFLLKKILRSFRKPEVVNSARTVKDHPYDECSTLTEKANAAGGSSVTEYTPDFRPVSVTGLIGITTPLG